MISQSSVDAERLKLLRPGDLVTPALWFVQSEVKQRLSEETCSRLLWCIYTSRLVIPIVPPALL